MKNTARPPYLHITCNNFQETHSKRKEIAYTKTNKGSKSLFASL